MLKIHSFLHRTKSMIKKTLLDSYRSCIMITAYMLVAIIIILSSDNLYGRGSNVVEAYAKVDNDINTFSPVEEETANEAQIQADDKLSTQLGKTLNNQSTGVLFADSLTGELKFAETELDIIRKDIKEDMFEETKQIIEEKNEANEKEEKERLKELKELKDAKEKEREAKERAKLAKKKEKEAKVAALSRNSSSQLIHLSNSDKKILQRIVEAEATGEDIKGKMLVANVILNRIASDKFPDTVEKVVFQRNGNTVQFSPIKDGRYWSVRISKDTVSAVNRVLNGEDYSQGALFFSARSKADRSSMSWFDRHLKWLFKYGGHEFYTTRR